MYEQFAAAIHQKYPQLTVEGSNYPPPPLNAQLASILSMVKFVVIGIIISGINPFQQFGMETPNFFIWASENKVYACMMAFFISNFIEGQLLSTGAFEVEFNDLPVWSKLEVGRIPSPQEMFQIIDNNLRMHNANM